MTEIQEYEFTHPAGYEAVYTDKTVEKMNARRPGRLPIRFNIVQKETEEGPVVIADITPTELQAYQEMAEKQGNNITVNYYQAAAELEEQGGLLSIQNLRRQTGLTAKEFGDYLYGIPIRSIQNWEGGQKKCPDYLIKLIEYKLKNDNLIP